MAAIRSARWAWAAADGQCESAIHDRASIAGPLQGAGPQRSRGRVTILAKRWRRWTIGSVPAGHRCPARAGETGCRDQGVGPLQCGAKSRASALRHPQETTRRRDFRHLACGSVRSARGKWSISDRQAECLRSARVRVTPVEQPNIAGDGRIQRRDGELVMRSASRTIGIDPGRPRQPQLYGRLHGGGDGTVLRNTTTINPRQARLDCVESD
jgi:hypothetical protein